MKSMRWESEWNKALPPLAAVVLFFFISTFPLNARQAQSHLGQDNAPIAPARNIFPFTSTITDTTTQKPFAAVNSVLKGKSIGSASDHNGRFQLFLTASNLNVQEVNTRAPFVEANVLLKSSRLGTLSDHQGAFRLTFQ